MKKILHLSHADKGGVGKSILSLVLIHVLDMLGLPVVVFDCDSYNNDVGRACDGTYPVYRPAFTDNPDEIASADEILEILAPIDTHAVMNCPAQVSRAINYWKEQGSLDAARELALFICIWFVTSGEQDSVVLFLNSLQMFPEIPHILVRNVHFTEKLLYDYSNPDANEMVQAALLKFNVPVVTLPKFTATDIDIIRAHNLTLREACTSSHLTIAARSRVKRALTNFYEQVSPLEIFHHHAPKTHSQRRGKDKSAS